MTSITESQRQMIEEKNREALENLQAANENLLMENYDLKSKVETLETNAAVERLKFLEIIKEQNFDQNDESEDFLKNLTRIFGHEILSKQEKLQRDIKELRVTQNLTSVYDKQILSEQNKICQEIEELKNTNSSLSANIRASEITDPALLKRKSVFFNGEPESISVDVKSSDVKYSKVTKSSEDLNFDSGTGKFTVEYDGFYYLSIFLSPIDDEGYTYWYIVVDDSSGICLAYA